MISESGTVLTGQDIYTYRILTVRRGLILKIDTGMSLTRAVSCLAVAQHGGITRARNNRQALRDVNRWLAERNVEPKWSRKYPQG